jgi:WD40-like Beta Propeller Repeat
MGSRLGLAVLVGASAFAGFAAPAGSGGSPPSNPDGVLVLGVVVRHGGVTTERAVVADPRTGRTRARRLEGGSLCAGPVLALGDRVIVSGSRGRRPVLLSLPLALTGPPDVLAAADQVVPSSARGRLWLGRTERGRRNLKFASLREVTAGGRTVYRVRHDLPRWGAFEGSVAGRLILGRRNGLELWDPRARRVISRLNDAWVIATGGDRLASCSSSCRTIRLSTRATNQRLLHPPPGTRLSGMSGSFSPDGRRLAVPVVRRGDTHVAVADLETGHWSVVPGGGQRSYPSLAWSPSGRWLYFSAGHRLVAWRDGSPQALRLPIRPGGTVLSIAAAR